MTAHPEPNPASPQTPATSPSGGATPLEAAPPETAPPQGALPQDSLPQDALPQDALPQDSLTQDSLTQPVTPPAAPPQAPSSRRPESSASRPLNQREREARSLVFNAGYIYRTVIDPQRAGLSAAQYLATDFPHSTPSEWQARLARGEVRIGGEPIAAERLLRAGEQVEWHRPGWLEPETPRQFGLIHLDQHLLAVDKPSGLPTLPGAGYLDNTLLALVQAQYPEAQPLHRLGRATSGLVLFARTPEVAATVSRQWPQLRKIYRALAQGVATQDEYHITTPIGPQPHPRLGTVHAAHPGGKASQSAARVLARFASATLFEVEIPTGRPHQIRIHLASIGHPLVGDPLYGAGGLPLAENPGLPGDPGYHLHAHRLDLPHPVTGSSLTLIAPPPPELRWNEPGSAEAPSATA